MLTNDMKMFRDWMTEQGMGINPDTLEYVLDNPHLLNDRQAKGLEEYMEGFQQMFAPRDAYMEIISTGV